VTSASESVASQSNFRCRKDIFSNLEYAPTAFRFLLDGHRPTGANHAPNNNSACRRRGCHHRRSGLLPRIGQIAELRRYL